MANAPATSAPGAENGVPARRRHKTILAILVAAPLLLGIGGAAGWYISSSGAGAAGTPVPNKPKAPVFMGLDTFTVNLQPDPRSQFLQVNITLNLETKAVEEVIRQYMPEVRNRVLLMLSSRRARDIASAEGKQQLATAVADSLNLLLRQAGVAMAAAEPKASTTDTPNAGTATGADSSSPDNSSAPQAHAPAAPVPRGPVQGVLFTSFVIQ